MWNEEHAFEISTEKEAMIEVFDKENVGQDKFMGELKVIGPERDASPGRRNAFSLRQPRA